jgi:uncharacterized protein (TIGR03435 family)
MRASGMRSGIVWPSMKADRRRRKEESFAGVYRRSPAANSVFPGLLLILAATCFAQTAAPPAFDVASIKPTTAEPGSGSGINTDTGRIAGRNVTLKRCIRGAYNIPEAQIFGGPKWVDDERYDIDAKAPDRAGGNELMAMLQQLLAERFKLVIHRETRPLAGYALVVGKKGIAAKPSESTGPSRSNSNRHSIEGGACSMSCLATKLAEVLHVPVADATGVEGRFDFKLEWTPDELQSGVLPALEEQLGLKLEARKVPTAVIVIDSAEKATAN